MKVGNTQNTSCAIVEQKTVKHLMWYSGLFFVASPSPTLFYWSSQVLRVFGRCWMSHSNASQSPGVFLSNPIFSKHVFHWCILLDPSSFASPEDHKVTIYCKSFHPYVFCPSKSLEKKKKKSTQTIPEQPEFLGKSFGVDSLIRKPSPKRPAWYAELWYAHKRPSFGSSMPIKSMKTLELSS